MKDNNWMIIPVSLTLGSFWLGAYAAHLSAGTWMYAPAVTTMSLGCSAGIVIFAFKLIHPKDETSKKDNES